MFLPESFSPGGKTYSEEKAAEIDEEISKVVEDTHLRVQKILGEKREVLNTLAKLLLEKEIIQGDEMRALMGKTKPAAPALPGGAKGELPSPQPAA
jgi:cell division protease FtsH